MMSVGFIERFEHHTVDGELQLLRIAFNGLTNIHSRFDKSTSGNDGHKLDA